MDKKNIFVIKNSFLPYVKDWFMT